LPGQKDQEKGGKGSGRNGGSVLGQEGQVLCKMFEGSEKQVYNRDGGLSKGKEFTVYSLRFTVTPLKVHFLEFGKEFEHKKSCNVSN
jgi:hypothetical protein